ncbi:MAG TPA: Fe-S cluster assembly protein SufD [Streptosporangiaceae bacterium]|nr:Fe-S cluster assembly protein SufD [Streptosporangiaceae bacterium]
MAGIQGAVETAVPSSRLHGRESYDVADFPVPNGREEEWRFTPLRRLHGLHTEGGAASSAGLSAGAESAFTNASPPGKVIAEADAAPEVRVEVAGRDDPRIGRAFVPADRVSARAYNSFSQATILTVPKDTVTSRPTVLSVHGERSGQGERSGVRAGAAAFGHLLVEVEPFAEAVLVLDHSGSAVYADNVEFVVREGGSLSVVSVQGWADDAVHLSHHHAQLGKDARIKHTAVTLGGNVVRLAPSVRYTGPGGDAELLGLYFTDEGQHLEHRLFVDHAVRDCRSRVEYKGALQGEGAHAVWIGDVIIRAEATGTDTYEYNRNLVLTDGTRVDSVPNLEILTGEVAGAGHASASGRLEDHHLFYLMARGIPYKDARRLVIRGFFGQLIERIDVPSLRTRVAAAVEAELVHSVDEKWTDQKRPSGEIPQAPHVQGSLESDSSPEMRRSHDIQAAPATQYRPEGRRS